MANVTSRAQKENCLKATELDSLSENLRYLH